MTIAPRKRNETTMLCHADTHPVKPHTKYARQAKSAHASVGKIRQSDRLQVPCPRSDHLQVLCRPQICRRLLVLPPHRRAAPSNASRRHTQLDWFPKRWRPQMAVARSMLHR